MSAGLGPPGASEVESVPGPSPSSLLVAASLCYFLACSGISPISACDITGPSSMRVSSVSLHPNTLSVFSWEHQSLDRGLPSPLGPHLNWGTSAKTLVPSKVPATGIEGSGLEHTFLGDTIRSTIPRYKLVINILCDNSGKNLTSCLAPRRYSIDVLPFPRQCDVFKKCFCDLFCSQHNHQTVFLNHRHKTIIWLKICRFPMYVFILFRNIMERLH